MRAAQLHHLVGLQFATLQDWPSGWAAVNCHDARAAMRKPQMLGGERPRNSEEKGGISASAPLFSMSVTNLRIFEFLYYLFQNDEPFRLSDPHNWVERATLMVTNGSLYFPLFIRRFAGAARPAD
jgi:hypothetical protein